MEIPAYVATEGQKDRVKYFNTKVPCDRSENIVVMGDNERQSIDNSLTMSISRKNMLQAEQLSDKDGFSNTAGRVNEGSTLKVLSVESMSGSMHRNILVCVDETVGNNNPGCDKCPGFLGCGRCSATTACSSHEAGDARIPRDGTLCDFRANEGGLTECESKTFCSNVRAQKPNNSHNSCDDLIRTKCAVALGGPAHTDTEELPCRNIDKTENVTSEVDETKFDGYKKRNSKIDSESGKEPAYPTAEEASTCLGKIADIRTTDIGSERHLDIRNKDIDCLSQMTDAVSEELTSVCDIGQEGCSTQSAGERQQKPVKYKCLKCSCVMKDKRLVDNHSCDTELDEEKVKITIVLDTDHKSFVCKECDYSNSGHSFEEHLMCHLMVRPYQCLYCKECFINRKEISRHVLKSHNGAKMSCALRALRKAKALIKEVSTSGTITFMAKVAGKVPLEKDPDKKKKFNHEQINQNTTMSGNNISDPDDSQQKFSEPDQSQQNIKRSDQSQQKISEPDQSQQKISEADQSQQNICEPDQSHQNICEPDQSQQIHSEPNQSQQNTSEPNQSQQSIKKLVHSHEKMAVADLSHHIVTESDVCEQNMTKHTKNTDMLEQFPVTGKTPLNKLNIYNDGEVIEDQQSLENQHEYSKLRAVLTSESSSLISDVSQEDEINFPEDEEDSDSGKLCNESGLKIVASFSLQGMEPQESDFEKLSNDDTLKSGFILTPLREKQKEPEVLSFLGPERPIFKSDDDNDCTSMLPPPPLQPAPFHPSNKTSLREVAVGMKVSSPNFFICGFNCLFSSMNAAEFQEHNVNFHSTEMYFPCYYCGHRSPNESDLSRHVSNHTQSHNKSSHLYVCGNAGCWFGTNMVADYINHIKTLHSDILELLCYSCGDTFLEPSLLQTHVENNVIHIVNCPHCASKATDRKAILCHISTAHPGKAKMVSVAKHLICHDRKMNKYEQMVRLQRMLPPALTPAPVFTASASVIDQTRHDLVGDSVKSNSGSFLDVHKSRPSISSRDTPSPVSRSSVNFKHAEATSEGGKSPTSDSSDIGSVKVKDEFDEDADGCRDSGSESRTAYSVDENGMRKRIYIPMSERQAENYRCKYCTFIARDFKRMHCHEKSHGMPPSRKQRFKCMFCPQGFDSELKFRMHITCHPGLIKFLLYRCKKCEFDTNQKHTVVRHISCNRDHKHRGFGPIEDQYTVVSRSLESRVLECESCDYMTRHKIHMSIHYQRTHNILKDRGEFTIEGVTPTDTPISSYDLSSDEPSMSPSYNSLRSPQNSNDDIFDFTKPSGNAKKSKDKVILDTPVQSVTQITERNELFNKMVTQQASLQPDHVLENQMRKFKCPICQYLLPKAADLKSHVKRHSEIGQITLVMFRCKYCSSMSTARELIYEHLFEKHPGKPIHLVKKIVAIDTTDIDKSFAETSMEESLDQLEESLHKEIMCSLNPGPSQALDVFSHLNYEQLFVIPEGGETFSAPLQCPKCPYSSHNRSEIIQHVSALHLEVKVIGGDEDVDILAKANKGQFQQQIAAMPEAGPLKPHQTSQEEVLIVPDDQIFKEPALCSRCNFTTVLRREMVIHLQQNHPEISVMGRNSYPCQVSVMGQQLNGLLDESCVVGSGSLDARVRCLYENYGTHMKCLICAADRPKKYFIHVHILRHLNIYLWKCAFCPHRGLQKYKMVDHIKKIHSGKPLSVRYLRVNVEEKVAQFLEHFSFIKSRKVNSDEGLDVQSTSMTDDNGDQASSRVRQKSPGPAGIVDCSSSHTLGSDNLDEKIRCLYDSGDGAFFKCVICPSQFQRRFAVHRHIIMSHLKVALLSCAYCGMEDVERHQIVDHILACHKPAPVSILPLNIDLHLVVSDFLTKMAARELGGGSSDTSKFSDERTLTSSNKSQNLTSSSCSKNPKLGMSKMSPSFRFGNKDSGASSSKKTSTVDPDVLMLGRHALDKELSCLYQERKSGQLRCLACGWEFPRKYPLHRHIMLKHLKMSLVGCPYCPFEGIEKYLVSTHMKEQHDGKPVNIKYLRPDVGARVSQFVEAMTSFGDNDQCERSSGDCRDNPLLVVPKLEKEDKADDGGKDSNEKDGVGHGGLVVAMFGKKKPSFSLDDVVVKAEVDDDADEEYKEMSNIDTNSDDEGKELEMSLNSHDDDEDSGNDESELPEDCKSNNSPTDNAKKLYPRHPRFDTYSRTSYRSPAGGKPKALDVITKIKVLKSKEGSTAKFYCEKCKFTSLHRSNIVRHIYKIHEKYQTHMCPMCNYRTLSIMLMQMHLRNEHQGVNFSEDSFKLKTSHSQSRHKPFMGPLSFQKGRQDLHSEKPAQKTPTTASTSNSSNNSGPKQYACAYCHYETSTQEDILKHTRNNHSQGNDLSSGITPPSIFTDTSKPGDHLLACWDGSKKAVKRKLQVREDLSVKRKQRFSFEKGNELFQCGHCDIKETSMTRMQDHLTWDHPGKSFQAKRIPAWRFVCKSCAVKTMATSKMKYHLNRHVNYRPYTCTNCGAFFPSPDQCRRHSRSQAHEEQYTYVRNTKKESRVAELLEETRQLARKIQEEAAKDPDFDMSQADSFIAKFVESTGNLKNSAKGINKQARKARGSDNEGAERDHSKKQHLGKSPQTVGVEQDITIKCYSCDFTASNVSSVSIHHNQKHHGKKFLWTEMERGFTCDRSGEALPECLSVPSSSTDVGYTTRMTLGSGSNTMRFKCKTCDFSSCVIQAMKSHLKSHQPKGFICPYCSRSFSGKEKLMRHQYCLHKGRALWVIHLRMSGTLGSTAVKKRKVISRADTKSDMRTEGTSSIKNSELINSETWQQTAQEKSSHGAKVFVCSECSYTSSSLYDFRLHISQHLEEFKHKIQDSPLKCGYCPFIAEGEAEFSSHIETHLSTRSFQCGYCDYIAEDQSSVQQHLTSDHSSLDPKIVEVSRKIVRDQDRKDVPVLINLNPNVVLERISDAVLSQFGYPRSRDGSSSDEDELSEHEDNHDSMEAAALSCDGTDHLRSVNDQASSDVVVMNDQASSDEDVERLMIDEEVSKVDMNEAESGHDDSRKCLEGEHERHVRMKSQNLVNDSENLNTHLNSENLNLEADSENLDLHVNSFADSENLHAHSSSVTDSENLHTDIISVTDSENPGRDLDLGEELVSDTDIMILEFSGSEAGNGSNPQGGNTDSDHFHNERSQGWNAILKSSTTDNGSSFTQSKDYTVFTTQESNSQEDEDDDDEEMTFDNDMTLASPLPMISLGDGVAMSPANVDEADSDGGQENDSADAYSEMLLDV